MWNPLSIPLALLGTVLAMPGDMARAVALLERAVTQAEALNETGDLVLAEIAAAREQVTSLMAGGNDLEAAAALILEEAAAARRAIEATRPTAELIAEHAEPMIAEARRASNQLRETQAVLERANDQIARALEMAQPLDRMTTRAQKLAGSLRRD